MWLLLLLPTTQILVWITKDEWEGAPFLPFDSRKSFCFTAQKHPLLQQPENIEHIEFYNNQ